MNHRGTEDTEKKKKSPIARWRQSLKMIIVAFAIFIIVPLVLFLSYQVYRQLLYNLYHNVWQREHTEDYLVWHEMGNGEERMNTIFHASADEIWKIAQDCLKQIFCVLEYDENHKFPVFISFENDYGTWLRITRFEPCSEIENTTLVGLCEHLSQSD